MSRVGKVVGGEGLGLSCDSTQPMELVSGGRMCSCIPLKRAVQLLIDPVGLGYVICYDARRFLTHPRDVIE